MFLMPGLVPLFSGELVNQNIFAPVIFRIYLLFSKHGNENQTVGKSGDLIQPELLYFFIFQYLRPLEHLFGTCHNLKIVEQILVIDHFRQFLVELIFRVSSMLLIENIFEADKNVPDKISQGCFRSCQSD